MSGDRGTARLIGATTLASGLGLLLAPRLSLRLMGAGTAPPAPLLFRVVGMFMGVTGGLLADGAEERVVLRWSVVQKTGAAAAMTVGVVRGDYARRALAVAAFDAASAVVLGRELARRPTPGDGSTP